MNARRYCLFTPILPATVIALLSFMIRMKYGDANKSIIRSVVENTVKFSCNRRTRIFSLDGWMGNNYLGVNRCFSSVGFVKGKASAPVSSNQCYQQRSLTQSSFLRLVFPIRTNSSLIPNKRYRRHSQVRQFWWRGGHTQDAVVNADISKKRSLPSAILNYPVSVCSVQGHRDYMEDDFAIHSDFAACFDGHGGKAVSRYLRQNLYANLQAVLPEMTAARVAREAPSVVEKDAKEPVDNNATATTAIARTATVEDYVAALEVALDKVDREILKIHHWSYQGSTALLCWIHTSEEVVSSDSDQKQPVHTLITSNIGDCRSVLCRNGSVIALSRDHKPEDPIEIRRIHNLGGKVVWVGELDGFKQPIPGMGLWRVNGCLSLTRVIGDRSERPAITSDPEISILPLNAQDEFIIMATDGLWDVMTSSDAVAFVRALIQNSTEYIDSMDRDAIVGLLIEEALRRGSFDNITVIIIWLR